MEFLPILSTIATIATILLFLTGSQICRQIRSQGNTKNVAMFPFLTMFLSAVVWLKYGILKEDGVIILVNGTGMSLATIYLGIYYYYSTNKAYVYRILGLSAMVLVPFLSYIKFWVRDHDTALSQLGLVCSAGCILMYGSPLVSVSQVVRTKSTEYLSFPLCLGNFLVSGMWFIYGRMIADYVLQIPNFIGSMLGLLQVLLFAIYPSGGPKKYDMSGSGSII